MGGLLSLPPDKSEIQLEFFVINLRVDGAAETGNDGKSSLACDLAKLISSREYEANMLWRELA